MNTLIWVLNIAIAILSVINTVSWGFCIRDVGDPQLSIGFLIKLVLNKWFIIAMASAFTAAILSYIVLREMGVLVGRFFLSLGAVATILVCTFVLNEKLTLKEWIGVALIVAGVILVGR